MDSFTPKFALGAILLASLLSPLVIAQNQQQSAATVS